MWSLHVVTWPNYMSCEPVPVPLLTFIIMSRSHAVLMWNLGRMAKLLKRPIGWSEWPLSSTWQFSQSKSWSQLRADLHGDNVPIFLDTAVPMTLVQALMSNILGDPGWIRLAGQHHIILINNQYNIDIYIYICTDIYNITRNMFWHFTVNPGIPGQAWDSQRSRSRTLGNVVAWRECLGVKHGLHATCSLFGQRCQI